MVSVKLADFGGMIPAADAHLLPDTNAALAKDVWLYSGTLKGFVVPEEIYTTQQPTTRSVYRLPNSGFDSSHLGSSDWMEFSDPDANVIRSPTINDSFQRYYWASPSDIPRYNTLAAITTGTGYEGSNGMTLGITTPQVVPGVTVSGGPLIAQIRAIVHSSTTVTVTTVTAHGMASGTVIQIQGCSEAAYNGTFSITSTGANTFTYIALSAPAANATVIGFYTIPNPNITSIIFAAPTASQAIAALTYSGLVATVTTGAPHGLATGNVVVVSGVIQPNQSTTYYNGTFIITVTGANTFTYLMLNTPGANPTSLGSYIVATVCTATTATPHGMATGTVATISGAIPAAYNGTFPIISTSSTTFTYQNPANPGTNATVMGQIASGDTVEVRAYVYTWVSAYGEEGPPSPANSVTTGFVDATWNIALTSPTATDTTGRNYAYTNIYRTVTASTGIASFYLVATVPVTQLTYADQITDTVAASANQLQSTEWTPPPQDLQGMALMPNGIIAGFDSSNQIWFCEPYRPHAWPSPYTLSCSYPIIGLGVIGQTLIVCTAGPPFAISGITPATMSMISLAANEPCLSRGSIVSTPDGVYYASPNGVQLCTAGLVVNATLATMTKDKWNSIFNPSYIRACRLGNAYYTYGFVKPGCFEATVNNVSPGAFEWTAFEYEDYSYAYTGALIDMGNQRVSVVELTTDQPIYNVFVDPWSAETMLLQGNQVLWLNLNAKPTKPYIWQSKIMQPTIRKNFAAMRVWFNNNNGIAVPNGPYNTSLTQELTTQLGIVSVWADGVLVMVREIRYSGELIRLPSGFKATYWQFGLQSQVEVFSIEAATAAKELIGV